MAFERRIPEGAEPREEVLDLFSRVALLGARPAAFRVRRILGAGLGKDARVLDVGTGPGAVPLALARACPGASLVGVDISPGMLERARRSAGRSGTRLLLAAGDGERLPVRDHAAEVVLCLFTLHHVEDPGALLRELDRVLRPAGSLLLIDFRRDMPRMLFRLMDAAWQGVFLATAGRHGLRDSVRSARRPDEVEALLREHRLKRFRVTCNPVELFVTTTRERGT